MASRLFHYVVEIPLVWAVLWLGLVALTVALLVLMRSRWGQNRPLRKCAVLSLVTHVLLACLATTVQIVTGVSGPFESPTTRVTVITAAEQQHDLAESATGLRPWEQPADPPPMKPEMGPARPLAASTGGRVAELSTTTDVVTPIRFAASSWLRAPAVAPDPGTLDHAAAKAAQTAPAAATPVEPPTAARRTRSGSPLPLPAPGHAPLPETGSQPERAPVAKDTRTPIGLATPPVPQRPTPDEEGAGTMSVEPPMRSVARPVPAAPVDNGPVAAASENPPMERIEASSIGTGLRGATPDALSQLAPDHHAAQSPTIYRNRLAPDRAHIVDAHGGSAETEAAVQAALQWLADNQSADGRWDPDLHEAGHEHVVLGQDRQGAGLHADTGITGLALLAFLGAGETHLTGSHRKTVRQGIGFLMRAQAADGCLAGRACLFARMYCHAMATFALSEAYAMTGDPSLEATVRRAVDYILRTQDHTTGGWRYRPGDPGDTSQLGWQAMALKSAELAGVVVPAEAWRAARRFLASVAAGTHGGLASYRPRSAPSRTMTAEALACHKLLGTSPDPRAVEESAAYVLEELPGDGRPNLYYWYYATLALYQVQGDPWRRWNDALKKTLLDSQRTAGHEAGSWDANTVWGGYGGRVYSTAVAALSLEVYYRYLPVYVEAGRQGRNRK